MTDLNFAFENIEKEDGYYNSEIISNNEINTIPNFKND